MNNKNTATNQPADTKAQRHTPVSKPGQLQEDMQKPGSAKSAQGESQSGQSGGRPGSDNAAKSPSAHESTNQRFAEDRKPGRSADGARPDNRSQAAGTASQDASNIEAPDNDEQAEAADANMDEADGSSPKNANAAKQSELGSSQANKPGTSTGRTDSGRDLKKPSTQTQGGRKN